MKTRNFTILFVALMMSLSFAFAIPADEYNITEEINTLTGELNGKPLHENFQSIFGNERIQVTFMLNNNATHMVNVIIENEMISTGIGTINDTTLDLTVSEETYRAVRESPEPMQAALDAYNDGLITKDAHGLGKTIKFAFASAVLKVMSWFS